MILLSDYNNPNRNPKSITILSLRPYQFIQPEKEKKRYSWWGRSAEDDDTIHTGKTKGKKGVGGWAEEINESVVLWLLQSFVFFSVFHWFRWHYVHLLPARVFGGGYNNHNALKGERVNPPPPVENYFQIFSNSPPMPKSFRNFVWHYYLSYDLCST